MVDATGPNMHHLSTVPLATLAPAQYCTKSRTFPASCAMGNSRFFPCMSADSFFHLPPNAFLSVRHLTTVATRALAWPSKPICSSTLPPLLPHHPLYDWSQNIQGQPILPSRSKQLWCSWPHFSSLLKFAAFYATPDHSTSFQHHLPSITKHPSMSASKTDSTPLHHLLGSAHAFELP